MSMHTDLLTKAERERKWPNQRPKDAATLIVVDRAGPDPKVLMGKRHAGHKFMPGKFVFPGGRLDPADRRMSVAGALPSPIEEKLLARMQRPSPGKARALALAAIRETFEETGLLIGTREMGAPEAAPPGPWAEFAARGVFPVLEEIRFIARAITPPKRPKRFDARFFTIDSSHIVDKVEGIIGPDAELTELVWVSLEEAINLDLPTITRVVLSELKALIDAGFAPRTPVPFYYEERRKWKRELL